MKHDAFRPRSWFDRLVDMVGRLSWFEKVLYSLVLWAAIFRVTGII